MTRILWTLALSLSLALPAIADDDDKKTVRTLRGSWPAVRSIHLKLPPGEMRVVPATDGRFAAEIDVLCNYRGRRCEDRAEDLSLETRPGRNRLELEVDGVPSNLAGGMSFRGRIRVPRGTSVKVDLGVGELEIRGIEGHLEADVGVGEVRIHVPERAVRFVELNVGVGDGELVGPGNAEARGWLGKRVDWTGKGTSNIRVSLGVGQAKVTLD